MRYVIFAAALLCSCNKSDSAKDKEIAELRARLAQTTPSQPSLGSVQKPQPELSPSRPVNEEETRNQQALARITRVIKQASVSQDQLALLVADASTPEVKKITYAHLTKNAMKYQFSPYKITGHILEITERDNLTSARVAIDWYGNMVFWVVAPGENEFVQGDWIDAVGFLTGVYSYTSQAGWNITIPEMISVPFRKRGTLARISKDNSKPAKEVQHD